MDPSRIISCDVEPDEPFVCGEKVTVTFHMSILQEVSSGGAIRLYFTDSPYYARPPKYGLAAKGFVFFSRIQFQTDAPDADGYLTVAAKSGKSVHIDPPGGKCFFTIFCDQSLQAGDELALVVGDKSGGGLGADVGHHPTYGPWQLICEVDRKGNGAFEAQCDMPNLQVVTAEAAELLVRVKPQVQPDTPTDMQIMVTDRFGNHVEGYQGAFVVSLDKGDNPVIQSMHLNPPDDGARCFPQGIVFKEEGIHRVAVKSADNDAIVLSGTSNPVDCRRRSDEEYELFWGDLHGHSHCTDATHSPEFFYRYGRNQGFLDFCALTDHDTFTPDIWEKMTRIAAETYEPGRFTTFLGYEWGGDFEQSIVVLFKNAGGGYHPSYEKKDVGPEEFLNLLDGEEVILARHDMPSLGKRWIPIDAAGKMERLVEMHSAFHTSESRHGPLVRGELDENNSIQAALADGLRFGFVGCSDTHIAMPGRRRSVAKFPADDMKNRHYGLTAVYAGQNTREALFSALYDRRCYAATDRILLDFRVNGFAMGQEVQLDGHRTIEIRAAGTAPFVQIDIVKNNQVIHSSGQGAMDTAFEYNDRSQIAVNDYYYVRVVQQDGGMAWASPIWVNPL
jgi:hypothetical protein